MKNIFLLSLTFALFFVGCSSSSDNNRKIQDEMIAIHDEVMPMMGTFVRDIQKIDSILLNIDEYKTQNPRLDTAELTQLRDRLETTHDSMNDWMHDLNLNFEGKSDDQIKAYLEVEKDKIQDINNEFIEVSDVAKQTLSKYQL
ncbi:hypothetical protein [Albibacterium indicum]|uniref:hypothetical protein n=1 Tax=Albibacterium indicum TaxID=2292082 RepID=UPI000E4DB495|nr:hypothetical protein [Pedobacter indicus]